jgi:predicted solute-binding protein
VRRSSIRIKAKHRGTSIAKMAEKNLCRRLGIVEENEDVTEQAIQEFVDMFKTQIPSRKVAALRALFRLDDDYADAVETALINHGGQSGLDLEVTGDA